MTGKFNTFVCEQYRRPYCGELNIRAWEESRITKLEKVAEAAKELLGDSLYKGTPFFWEGKASMRKALIALEQK